MFVAVVDFLKPLKTGIISRVCVIKIRFNLKPGIEWA